MHEPLNTSLEQLIKLVSRLPGFGQRSARRSVLHLLKNREALMLPLSESLRTVAETIKTCETCGNLDTSTPCNICTSHKRDKSIICVVEEVADLWAIERSGMYKGLYHVLGGTLSAIEGRGPGQLRIHLLTERTSAGEVTEVILATNATVEGQTTAHYISECLKSVSVRISRLAHGIPMGGELDYLDEGTLGTAFQARLPAA
ncbi:MAG: recR [Rickettsiales bacterium]|jgi:recombination protein RecR|nr:recR [Rickettsiales bacterium]